MIERRFDLTINISYENAPELHNQFKHYLEHVLNARFVTGTKDKQIVVIDNQNRQLHELFDGPEGKFRRLYHITEIF